MASAPSFPHLPYKWRHGSLVRPRDFIRYYFPRLRGPRRCVLLWSAPVLRELVEETGARPLGGLAGTFVVPPRARSVGVGLPRGIGAPATISYCEELAALGAREFVGVGFAGALSSELAPGDLVVCDGAVRDEGTSHHYAPAHVAATPSPSLTAWVRGVLESAGLPYREGPSWTTDAPYRETRVELRRYRSEGVLTVDMEASALFVFARARRVRAASVFVISDVLEESGWKPHFHRMRPRLAEITRALLRAGSTAPGGRAARVGTARAGSRGAARPRSPRGAGRSRDRS